MFHGYIKLHRKIFDTSFYRNPDVCRLAIHILLKANHAPNNITVRGEPFKIERGQFITGLPTLSFETGLSIARIRSALRTLRNCNFIDSKATNKFSLITVCNYGCYQGSDEDDNRQVAGKSQATNKQVATNNNDKNDKNEKKYIYSADFEKVYAMYPNKKGKKEAERHFKASVKTQEDLDNIKLALKNYLKSKTVKEGYIQNASTWFNDWQAHIPPKVEPKPKRAKKESVNPFGDLLGGKNEIQTKREGESINLVELT